MKPLLSRGFTRFQTRNFGVDEQRPSSPGPPAVGPLGPTGHACCPGLGVPLTHRTWRLPRIPTPVEVDARAVVLHTHRDQAMVAAMVFGGLRRCEVLGLQMEDLRVGERRVFTAKGKGGHQRLVPVSTRFFVVVLSAGPQVGVLPSHGLDVLGRGLEQLVGQVSQGPGDRDLVPDLGHRRVCIAAMTLAAGGQVGWRLAQQDDIGARVVPGLEDRHPHLPFTHMRELGLDHSCGGSDGTGEGGFRWHAAQVLALDPQDGPWSGVHEPGVSIGPPDEVWRLAIGTPPACQGELRPAVHSKPVPRRARFGLIPDEFFNAYPRTPRWSDGSFTATFWWPYPSAVVHASAEA